VSLSKICLRSGVTIKDLPQIWCHYRKSDTDLVSLSKIWLRSDTDPVLLPQNWHRSGITTADLAREEGRDLGRAKVRHGKRLERPDMPLESVGKRLDLGKRFGGSRQGLEGSRRGIAGSWQGVARCWRVSARVWVSARGCRVFARDGGSQ
jgi:hypothetical protein